MLDLGVHDREGTVCRGTTKLSLGEIRGKKEGKRLLFILDQLQQYNQYSMHFEMVGVSHKSMEIMADGKPCERCVHFQTLTISLRGFSMVHLALSTYTAHWFHKTVHNIVAEKTPRSLHTVPPYLQRCALI